MFDEVPKYKKKSTKRAPPKSKHKHRFEECILEYEGRTYNKERGFVKKPDRSFGRYCVICGRIHIGGLNDHMEKVPYGNCVVYRHTDYAKKELDHETRTLPTFWVDDLWKQKFVYLDDVIEGKSASKTNERNEKSL